MKHPTSGTVFALLDWAFTSVPSRYGTAKLTLLYLARKSNTRGCAGQGAGTSLLTSSR